MSNDDSLERTYNDRLRERLEDMNTPTPRTDEFFYRNCGPETAAYFARQLEQELNEVKDALDEVLDEIIDNADGAPDATGVGAFCTGLIRQHNALMMGDRLSARQERDQLRKVVDELASCLDVLGTFHRHSPTWKTINVNGALERHSQLPHIIEQRKSK